MDGLVCGPDGVSQPMRRRRQIPGDHRRRETGCLSGGKIGMNRLDRHPAGDLACIAATHAIADDIESQCWIREKAVLIVPSFQPYIGLDAMPAADRHAFGHAA